MNKIKDLINFTNLRIIIWIILLVTTIYELIIILSLGHLMYTKKYYTPVIVLGYLPLFFWMVFISLILTIILFVLKQTRGHIGKKLIIAHIIIFVLFIFLSLVLMFNELS